MTISDHAEGGFLGIDLSWKCAPYKKEATAICHCHPDGSFEDPFLVTDDLEIIDEVQRSRAYWLGIDAPLKVPNAKGLRSGERAAVRSGLRILPTNRTFLEGRCGGVRGEELVERLQVIGYHAVDRTSVGPGLIFETYPYSLVKAILPDGATYKRGRAPERRRACLEILSCLQGWEPSMHLPDRLVDEIEAARPSELHGVADKVDAVLCAACLYAHWLYRGKRTRLVGEEKDGYILLI